MSDQPTLYRRPTEAEIWADDPRWDETGFVPVKPVGTIDIYTHKGKTYFDSDKVPDGVYALFPLEAI